MHMVVKYRNDCPHGELTAMATCRIEAPRGTRNLLMLNAPTDKRHAMAYLAVPRVVMPKVQLNQEEHAFRGCTPSKKIRMRQWTIHSHLVPMVLV